VRGDEPLLRGLAAHAQHDADLRPRPRAEPGVVDEFGDQPFGKLPELCGQVDGCLEAHDRISARARAVDFGDEVVQIDERHVSSLACIFCFVNGTLPI
jgi:hypothetical protein